MGNFKQILAKKYVSLSLHGPSRSTSLSPLWFRLLPTLPLRKMMILFYNV